MPAKSSATRPRSPDAAGAEASDSPGAKRAKKVEDDSSSSSAASAGSSTAKSNSDSNQVTKIKSASKTTTTTSDSKSAETPSPDDSAEPANNLRLMTTPKASSSRGAASDSGTDSASPGSSAASPPVLKPRQSGQYVDIPRMIGQLIKDYPADNLIKEMLQNSEDAGATEFKVYFDPRSFLSDDLINPLHSKAWQGAPGIFIIDNGGFKPEDWASIDALWQGSKQDLEAKIGRRGLGFRAIYNFTDLPQILSGSTLLVQDPRFFLENREDADWSTFPKGGITFNPYEMLVRSKYAGHLLPFSAPPYNVQTVRGKSKKNKKSACRYNGTIIWAPLRCGNYASPAEASVISPRVWTLDEMRELLVDQLGDEYRSYLLFLNSVGIFRMYGVNNANHNDNPNVEPLIEVEAKREEVNVANDSGNKSKNSSARSSDEKSTADSSEEFEVSRVTLLQQRRGEDLEEKFDIVKCGGGSVAALSAPSVSGCVTGTFYAGLPIRGLETGCELHVNAFFHPASDRKTLILDEDESKKETKENLEFLEQAASAARKLIEMRTARDGTVPLQFFPNPESLQPNTQKARRKFAECFYQPQEIAKHPNMHCDLSGNVLDSLGFLMVSDKTCSPALRDALRFLKAPCVALREAIIEVYVNRFDAYDNHGAAGGSASDVLSVARPASASVRGRTEILNAKRSDGLSATREFDGKLPVVLTASNLAKWMKNEKQLAFEISDTELPADESASSTKSRLQHCLALLDFFRADAAFDFQELEGLSLCPTLAGNVISFSSTSPIAVAQTDAERELAKCLSTSDEILHLEVDAERLSCFTGPIQTKMVANAINGGNPGSAEPTTECAQALFRWTAACKPADLHALDEVLLWRVYDSTATGDSVSILPWKHHDKIVANKARREYRCALQLCGVRVLLGVDDVDESDFSSATTLADMNTTLADLKSGDTDELLMALGTAAGDVEVIPFKPSSDGKPKGELNSKNSDQNNANGTSSRSTKERVPPSAGTRRGRDSDTDSDGEDLPAKRRDIGNGEYVEAAGMWKQWEKLRGAVAESWHAYTGDSGEGIAEDTTMTARIRSACAKLPIFESFGSQTRGLSARDRNYYARRSPPDQKQDLSSDRLDILRRDVPHLNAFLFTEGSNEDVARLAHFVESIANCRRVSTARQLLIDYKLMQPEDSPKFTKSLLTDGDFKEALKDLPCVPTARGGWQKPRVVVCLDDSVEKKHKNLVSALAKTTHYLLRGWKAEIVRLRELGVRKAPTTTEIYDVATSLSSASNPKSGVSLGDGSTVKDTSAATNTETTSIAIANELSHYCSKHAKTGLLDVRDVPWVPLAQKPKDWDFCPWKNDGASEPKNSDACEIPSKTDSSSGNDSAITAPVFARPADVVPWRERHFCGSVQGVADVGFSESLLTKELAGRKVASEDVLKQLNEIVEFNARERSSKGSDGADPVGKSDRIAAALDHIYKHKSWDGGAVEKLNAKQRNWVWTGAEHGFVSSSCVSKHDSAKSLAPWLHHLSPRWNDLPIFSAINADLSNADGCQMVISALKRIADKQEKDEEKSKAGEAAGKSGAVVSEGDCRTIVALVNLLASGVGEQNFDNVFLPKQDGSLAPACKVLVNDMPWLQQDNPEQLANFRPDFVFEDVSATNAEKLGGTLLTQHTAGAFVRRLVDINNGGNHRHSFVKPVGQGEPLKTRLKGILKDYDSTAVVKEIMQNANDAKLSEHTRVEIVYDLRQHDTVSVMAPELKEAQGPRLVAFNSGVWTDADFEGILKLGVGSKNERDPSEAKTWGKFGVGFNCQCSKIRKKRNDLPMADIDNVNGCGINILNGHAI